jgi:hypothetical protein
MNKKPEEPEHSRRQPTDPQVQVNLTELLQALQAVQAQTTYRPVPASQITPPSSGPQLGVTVQAQIVQGNNLAPAMLDALERHSAGAVSKMIEMAQRQQEFVIRANENAQKYTRADIMRGHYIAAGLSVIAIAAALASEKMGYPWVAGAFLTFPVPAIINALNSLPDRPKAK